MPRGRIVLISLGAVIIGVISAVILLGDWDSSRDSLSQEVPEPEASVNLGITYLTLNPMIAECNELTITSGALVTNVDPKSLADKAGVMVGDIIRSCDGVEITESNPLLGLIGEHHRSGGKISLEVLRETGPQRIEIPLP